MNNGNIRLGLIFAVVTGSVISRGLDEMDKSAWTGGIAVLLGLAFYFMASDQVNRGVKETIRLHDLEKAANKVNKTVR